MIFRSGPYFLKLRGFYLNICTLYFNLKEDAPYCVLVRVRLPHLPSCCWGDDSVETIINALWKYIDREEPKGWIFSCAWFYVKVDL